MSRPFVGRSPLPSAKPLIARAPIALAILLAIASALAPTMAGASPLVPTVEVQAYQGGVGWLAPDASGGSSGGDGTGRPLEMLRVTLDAPAHSDGLSLSVYQNGGWQGPVASGQAAGGAGGGSIQAVRLSLTGEAADAYDLVYRTSCVDVGWLGWASEGEVSGAPGFLAAEAIQVALVPKGGVLPQGGGSPTTSAPGIQFAGYVNGKGWDGPRASGNGVGEGGRALLGFSASVTGDGRMEGSIRYRVSTFAGWQGWAADGGEACAIDAGRPIQAIQLKLTGTIAKRYDLWYHVYAPGYGWLGYATDGATAGTTGLRIAAEAVQIFLVPKGAQAPGSTARPTVDVSEFSKIGWQNPRGYYQVSCRNVLPRPGAYWPFNYVTPSRIAVDASRDDCVQAFVQRAREYVGTPYVWDYACAPGVGVDCVGLVYQCAYATGMDMGEFNPWDHWATGPNGWHSHDAANLWNYGKIQRLPISQREYGDLIFFPGHVGIYVGGDQMINAWSPGVGVVYSSIWSLSPLGVGRLYVR